MDFKKVHKSTRACKENAPFWVLGPKPKTYINNIYIAPRIDSH